MRFHARGISRRARVFPRALSGSVARDRAAWRHVEKVLLCRPQSSVHRIDLIPKALQRHCAEQRNITWLSDDYRRQTPASLILESSVPNVTSDPGSVCQLKDSLLFGADVKLVRDLSRDDGQRGTRVHNEWERTDLARIMEVVDVYADFEEPHVDGHVIRCDILCRGR